MEANWVVTAMRAEHMVLAILALCIDGQRLQTSQLLSFTDGGIA